SPDIPPNGPESDQRKDHKNEVAIPPEKPPVRTDPEAFPAAIRSIVNFRATSRTFHCWSCKSSKLTSVRRRRWRTPGCTCGFAQVLDHRLRVILHLIFFEHPKPELRGHQVRKPGSFPSEDHFVVRRENSAASQIVHSRIQAEKDKIGRAH